MPEQKTKKQGAKFVLKLIGGLFLLLGVGCALLGPVEVYCFYLFAGDGPFAYEGFGFGSFMFGNIAVQIMGYYLIAALCLPLGYGHLRLRRWARTLALTLLWSWLVVGLPLLVVFVAILLGSKELAPAVALLFLILAGASYPLLPGLLIWFYRSRSVRLTFVRHDPRTYWTERRPQPLLVLAALFAFWAVVLHVPLFFRGTMPLFGIWLQNMVGFVVIDLAIWGLLLLAWGTLRARPWAWWAGIVSIGLLTASVVLTLVPSTWAEILALLDFPPTEVEILQGIPLRGGHLALFLGLPLLLTLIAVAVSKRHFRAGIETDVMRPRQERFEVLS